MNTRFLKQQLGYGALLGVILCWCHISPQEIVEMSKQFTWTLFLLLLSVNKNTIKNQHTQTRHACSNLLSVHRRFVFYGKLELSKLYFLVFFSSSECPVKFENWIVVLKTNCNSSETGDGEELQAEDEVY